MANRYNFEARGAAKGTLEKASAVAIHASNHVQAYTWDEGITVILIRNDVLVYNSGWGIDESTIDAPSPAGCDRCLPCGVRVVWYANSKRYEEDVFGMSQQRVFENA